MRLTSHYHLPMQGDIQIYRHVARILSVALLRIKEDKFHLKLCDGRKNKGVAGGAGLLGINMNSQCRNIMMSRNRVESS